MIILGIETSCDETALSIVEAKGGSKNPHFKVLGEQIQSQIDIHKQYGGVFPAVAKREHAKNIIPLFHELLKKTGFLKSKISKIKTAQQKKLEKILEREPELFKNFIEFAQNFEKPKIDAISVTTGPGLEPALWVGINFAKALNILWDIPIVASNHTEGHILSVLIDTDNPDQKFKIDYPAVALIISGGHTELVSIKKHLDYKVIGKTRDDAAGEAFDKVARMLGLPYPGGPEISKLAAESKSENECEFKLPRPMLNSDNLDFSFSGLKTSVLYLLKKISSSQEKTEITEDNKREIAKEFENSVKEVLLHKTEKALKLCKAKTLILGGGVTANKKIREAFVELIKSKNCQDIKLFIPKKGLSTDNATMIAIAGYSKAKTKKYSKYNTLNAQGNLGIDNSN